MMLEQVLTYLNNWFVLPGGIHIGNYSVREGRLELPFLRVGQYFRLAGSVFNDGLYKYPATLENEDFHGAIWALAVPKSVQTLAQEIENWQSKNGETARSPYQSESFGGYSYTKATDAETGGAVCWQSAFAARLANWRKI